VSFILCLNFVENVCNEKEMETTPSGDLNHSNAPSDIVNNNSEVQRTGEEVTKKDITQTGSASLSESMSPFSPIGTKTDVTKPHLLTQDGVTSKVEMHEQERQEKPPQQCTESNEHQQIIPTHSMVTDSRKGLEGKKSNVHELTQKFEDTVNIENCPKGEQVDKIKDSPLKREISHSSADGSESEEASDAESSSSDEDKDTKGSETPSQQTDNQKEIKKTKLSKKELKRMKKWEREKRRKKRKMNETENEPGTDNKNIPAPSTNKKESLTSKVICFELEKEFY
jgi:hypothetical protein